MSVQSASRLQSWVLKSEDKEPKKDDESSGKVPSGFEKLLKRSKRGASKTEGSEKQKGEEKEKEEKEKDEEAESKEDGDKDAGKDKKSSNTYEDWKKQYSELMFDPNSGGPRWDNWLMMALIGATGAYYVSQSKPSSREIAYQEMVQNYLQKNQISMITLCEDKTGGTFKYRANMETVSGEHVHMVLPQVENFLYKLDQVQREMGKDPNTFVPVKYGPAEGDETNPTLNLAMGLSVAALFALIYRSMHTGGKGAGNLGQQARKGSQQGGGGGLGGMMNMSKSNAQVFGVDKKIRTRFKHVAGMTNAKTEVVEFVDFLKNPEKYKKLGAKIPKGALLVGPPGTGKTLLAKAVAGEAGVPFLTVSGSDFVQMYVGVGSGRVRDLFKQAKEMSPSIIFIDEIDAVAKKRDQKFSSNDERDNTLNQLLVEMDGFATEESVIVLAATNLADSLDPAIKRPGRFDRTIEITLPTIDERKEIYNVHLKKIKVNKELTRDEYATKMSALTPGFSGADIANICNEGAIIAARTDKPNVSLKQFEEATERVLGGLEKKAIMTPAERKTVAYHEAGHAVTGWFLEHSNPLLKITIIPRSKGSLGFAQYLPDEVSLYTKEALIDMIKVALGGRVAEQIFFTKVTTGASDDIKKVTQIANGIVQIYGMQSEFGLMSYQDQNGPKPFSEQTAQRIDSEVKKLVEECYDEVVELLESKRELIENLAECLLEKESINLPEIIKVLGDRPFEMKESIKNYLQEMEQRAEQEAKVKYEEEQEAKAKAEADAAEPDHEAASSEEKKEESTESTEEKKESTDDSSEKKSDDKDKK